MIVAKLQKLHKVKYVKLPVQMAFKINEKFEDVFYQNNENNFTNIIR